MAKKQFPQPPGGPAVKQSAALQLLGRELRTYSPLKLNAGENASEYLGGTVPYEDARHRHVVGG